MVWAYLMFGESIGFLAVLGLVVCLRSAFPANRGT